MRNIDTLISTLTSNHCEEVIYLFYIKFIISHILWPFGFYFFTSFWMMSKGREVRVCILCLNYFRFSSYKTSSEIYKTRGVSLRKYCQDCHHQNEGDCEEGSLLRLNWVLKKRKIKRITQWHATSVSITHVSNFKKS